jgi:hypothetical protein
MSGEGPAAGPDAGARLVDAMHEWARSTFGEAESAHIATGAPECTWCPVCQLITVLRGDRPEVTERLSTAASAVADALQALLDASARPQSAAPAPAAEATAPTGAPAEPAPPGPRAGRRPKRRVQHIDLDDVAPGDVPQ